MREGMWFEHGKSIENARIMSILSGLKSDSEIEFVDSEFGKITVAELMRLIERKA